MSEYKDFQADIAVIGGSGFYTFLEDVQEVNVLTPYGKPSSPVHVGTLDGVSVAFLPRHGKDHTFPAHQVPYRANIFALSRLGVKSIFAPSAVGSLRPDWGPGTVVVPDQILDFSKSRVSSFFDRGAVHTPFADPYCASLSARLLRADASASLKNGGTAVVIEGPRFSTRAESRMFASFGGDIINMTIMPEAVLAREMNMHYASLSLVTDFDAGTSAEEAVSAEKVFQVFSEKTTYLKDLLKKAILAPATSCTCFS